MPGVAAADVQAVASVQQT